jgi:tetratricopeptide (TPR) repeat protein
MVDRLLVDLGTDGQAMVAALLDGEVNPAGESSPLACPFDDDTLEDLRWYLEDYLRAPFGVYGERGPEVENRLGQWGTALFSAVFGTSEARDAYLRMRNRGRRVELVFRSSSHRLLGLPWELIQDPARQRPLALELANIGRSLPANGLAEPMPVQAGRMRVLMVIARPAGTGDVGYRMIARPLMERLQAVQGQVDLVVLRPPTLNALQGELESAARAGVPFQVVHFDGHGMLLSRGKASQRALHHGDSDGVLVFERPGGGPDHVPASRLAEVLRTGQVAVAVLNACQSGAVGGDLGAAVATRLLQEGIASVVAMAYAVYAVAAAEFMTAFYDRLFAGDAVGAAVAAGRQRLFERRLRPSPKGEMPLADWLVPVHYLRSDVSFPQITTGSTANLDEVLDQLRQPALSSTGSGDLDTVGSFTGRDELFYQLEAAAWRKRVMVIVGPAGTGKTELAKAFGRWWGDTGGADSPESVFWLSCEPGMASFGLDRVITQIGLRVIGSEFAYLESAEQRAIVERLLATRRMLLIWDNFETVRSMPDPTGVIRPVDGAGCAELQDFLTRLAGAGHSTVIITSRTPEDWLGDICRIPVGGLASHEAAEYAEELLLPYPAAGPRRATRVFGELMEWLGGHPLSMRLVLPHLSTTGPEELLDGLRGLDSSLGYTDLEEGLISSLAASITYSFIHLGDVTRRLLAALCLLQGVADADVLMHFSQAPLVPERFRGASRHDWQAALADAARTGLLTPIDTATYQIHPALPAFLASQWRREESTRYPEMRDDATRALLVAHVGLGQRLSRQIESGDAALAYEVLDLQRRTLSSLLEYALAHGLWEEAQAIAQPLTHFWETRGMDRESDAWAERARIATESAGDKPPALGSPAGSLWLFAIGGRAGRQLRAGRLDEAERAYRQILVMLQAQVPSQEQEEDLAIAFHQLGRVAQERGNLDDAEDWYLKSLAAEQDSGNQLGISASFHQLGRLCQEQGRLGDAENWYLKSLAIEEELDNKPGMAASYGQLGVLAEDRERLDDAEDWYLKSLAIEGDLGDERGMARVFHQLGMVAQKRGRLDDAENWYLKSLAIEEELDNKPGMAASYGQLGVLAEDRGRLDDAEDWYLKSLAIDVELGNTTGMAVSYGHLGLLADGRGQHPEALEWTIRRLALFSGYVPDASGAGLDDLVRLTDQLGADTLEASWHKVTGSPLPEEIRRYLSSPPLS